MIALFAALIGPYFINWTDYRADFEREASRLLGQKVSVNGTARARLIPFPSITFTDVEVGTPNLGAPSMNVRTFRMDMEMAPFLSGNIRIIDMLVEGAQAHVTLDAAGRINWDWSLGTQLANAEIELQNLTLIDSRLRITQTAQQRDIELLGIDGTLSADDLTGPWHGDGGLYFNGKRYFGMLSTGVFNGQDPGRLRLDVQPESNAYRLQINGQFEENKGTMAYVGDIDFATEVKLNSAADAGTLLPIRARGPFKLDQDAAIATPLRVEMGAPEDPYAAEGTATLMLGQKPRFGLELDGQQLNFDLMAAAQKADRNDATKDAAAAPLKRAMAVAEAWLAGLEPPEIEGEIAISIPAVIYDEQSFRNLSLVASPAPTGWTIKKLVGDLPGRTTLEATGNLFFADGLAFDGDVLMASRQPSGVAEWLTGKVDDDIRAMPALGFYSRVSLTRERQNFRSLELQLGDNTLTGLADRTALADSQPLIAFRLGGETINLDALEALGRLVGDITGQSDAAHDLDIALQAKTLVGYGAEAKDASVALRMADGAIEIEQLSLADIAGAKIVANGSLADLYKTPNGNFAMQITGADLAPLVRLLRNVTQRQNSQIQAFFAGLDDRAALDPALLTNANLAIEGKSTLVTSADQTGFDLSAKLNGLLGGTELAGFLTASGADIASANGTIDIKADNRSGERILTLLGVPSLPLETIGQLALAFNMVGSLQTGAALDFGLINNDGGEYLNFSGVMQRAAETAQTLRAEGQMDIKLNDADPYLAALGLEVPGAGLGQGVLLTAGVSAKADRFVLSALSGQLGEADITGDVTLDMARQRPKISGKLFTSSLDMALFVDALMGQGYRFVAALEDASLLTAKENFAIGVSSTIDLDLALRAQRIHFDEALPAFDGALTLKLDQAGGSVEDFTAKVRQNGREGQLSGKLFAQNDNGTLIFNAGFAAQNVLAQAFLLGLFNVDAIDGDLNFEGTLAGRGLSMETLMAGLAGSGAAKLTNGAITGLSDGGFDIYLARSDAERLGLDDAAIDGLVKAQSLSGTLALPQIDFNFSIANGRMRLPPLRVATQRGTLFANIETQLADQAIRLDASLQLDAGKEGQEGSVPAIDFNFDGLADEATMAISNLQLTQFLQQRALEREQMRVAAQQTALLERQRLRREVRFYEFQERQRREAEEALRLIEEEKAAALILAREAAEAEEAARKAKEEAERQAIAQAKAEAAAKEKAEAVAKEKAEAAAKEKAADPVQRMIEDAPPVLAPPVLKAPELLDNFPQKQF